MSTIPDKSPDSSVLWYGVVAVPAALALTGVLMAPGEDLVAMDIAAIAGFIAMFGLIAADREVRDHPGCLPTLWTILAVHQTTALANVFGFTLIGADTDAFTFSEYARHRNLEDMMTGISVNLYRNLLIILHTLSGGSQLVTVGSSVFAFTLTALLFNRLLNILGVQRLRLTMLIAFGLLPHVIVFTSVTLREPFELLFFVAAVYYGLKFRIESGVVNMALFLLCSICLGVLHQVLIPFALLLIVILLLWPVAPRPTRSFVIGFISTMVIVAAITITSLHIMRSQRIYGAPVVVKMAKFDGDYFLWAIGGYREAIDGENPRTAFDVEIDTSSFSDFFKSLPALYTHYWFAPFPWRITNAVDLVAGAISLLRLAAIIIVIAGMWVSADTRRIGGLLVALFLLSCSTWVLGTTNYGQGIRHQVLSDWLLIAAVGLVSQHLIPRLTRPHRTESGQSRQGP